MSNLFWLTDAQMARLEPYVPTSHAEPRVDVRLMLSDIIFINRNGLRWRDAPQECCPVSTQSLLKREIRNNANSEHILFCARKTDKYFEKFVVATQLLFEYK